MSVTEFEDGNYNGNGSSSIFETSDEPIDELNVNSLEKIGDNPDDLEDFGIDDDSGISITCLDCVVWKNNDFQQLQKDTSPIKSGVNSRIEWTVIVGDSSGCVTLLDITDVFIPHIIF